jgi:hypothetical protein
MSSAGRSTPGHVATSKKQKDYSSQRSLYIETSFSAVARLVDDFTSLSGPCASRRALRRIRHTNGVERTLGESGQRTKVIVGLPGERSCVTFIRVAFDSQSQGCWGVSTTPRVLWPVQDLRRQLLPDAAKNDTPELDVGSGAKDANGRFTGSRLHRIWDATAHSARGLNPNLSY